MFIEILFFVDFVVQENEKLQVLRNQNTTQRINEVFFLPTRKSKEANLSIQTPDNLLAKKTKTKERKTSLTLRLQL
jgi:hypothetical protein